MRQAVKLLVEGEELYVLAKSEGRQAKEIPRRRLVRLLCKLRDAPECSSRDQFLLRLGPAKSAVGRAFGFVKMRAPEPGEEVSRKTFPFSVNRERLRQAELRDGHYLLRSNLASEDPAVWERMSCAKCKVHFGHCISRLGKDMSSARWRRILARSLP